jgi:hypothetical protein
MSLLRMGLVILYEPGHRPFPKAGGVYHRAHNSGTTGERAGKLSTVTDLDGSRCRDGQAA